MEASTTHDADGATATQEPLEPAGAEQHPDPPAAAAEPRTGLYRYMVLWARLPNPEPDPDDDDAEPQPLKWRELGWQEAPDARRAKEQAVGEVRDRGDAPALPAGWEPHPEREPFEQALRKYGLKLRAVARRDWPDEESIDITRLHQPPPELTIG